MRTSLNPPVLSVSELDRLAAQARAEAEASLRAPRWLVIGFWALIAFEIVVIAARILP